MSGLIATPSRYCAHFSSQNVRTTLQRISGLPIFGECRKMRELILLERNCFSGSSWEKNMKVKQFKLISYAIDASNGNSENDPTTAAIFPRIYIKDPFKRLGISREASEYEIQSARNFLIQKYCRHRQSVDAIETAHNKIIMQRFHERKNPKINIKKKIREVTESRVVQLVNSRFRIPSTKFIIKTSIIFVLLGFLTVLFPTEEGPTLQVAISLIATMYFIHDRLKNKLRACLYGGGAFAMSWLLGTFMMITVVPPVIKGLRSLEVTTALISYVLLWTSSTYLN